MNDLKVYWTESDFKLNVLPDEGQRITFQDMVATISLISRQLSGYSNYSIDQLNGVEIVNVYRMLSNFKILNPGEKWSNQEGNGYVYYEILVGLIIYDYKLDKLITLCIESIDIGEEFFELKIFNVPNTYEISYKDTLQTNIFEKWEYQRNQHTNEYELIKTLVNEYHEELNNEAKIKYQLDNRDFIANRYDECDIYDKNIVIYQ